MPLYNVVRGALEVRTRSEASDTVRKKLSETCRKSLISLGEVRDGLFVSGRESKGCDVQLFVEIWEISQLRKCPVQWNVYNNCCCCYWIWHCCCLLCRYIVIDSANSGNIWRLQLYLIKKTRTHTSKLTHTVLHAIAVPHCITVVNYCI